MSNKEKKQTQEKNKMTKSEYNAMTNNEKIAYLNSYDRRSKEFTMENAFSWSYATDHCEYEKDGNVFLPIGTKEKAKKIELTDEQEFFLTLWPYRNEPKTSKSFRLPNKFLEKMSKYAKEHDLKETEVIICGVEKLLKGDDNG